MKLAPVMIAALLCAPVVSANMMYRPEQIAGKAPESKEIEKPMCTHPDGASEANPYDWKPTDDSATESLYCYDFAGYRSKCTYTYAGTEANAKGKKASEICPECDECTYNPDSGNADITNVAWVSPSNGKYSHADGFVLTVKVTFNEPVDITLAGPTTPTITVTNGNKGEFNLLNYESSTSQTVTFTLEIPANHDNVAPGDIFSIRFQDIALNDATIKDAGKDVLSSNYISQDVAAAAGKVTVVA